MGQSRRLHGLRAWKSYLRSPISSESRRLISRLGDPNTSRICGGCSCLPTTPRMSARTTRTFMETQSRPSHSSIGRLETKGFADGSSPPPRPPQDGGQAKMYATLAVRVTLATSMVFCVTEYGFDITLCQGPSMDPTIQSEGEIVLVDKLKWHQGRVRGKSVLGLKDGDTALERVTVAQQRQREHERQERRLWKKSQSEAESSTRVDLPNTKDSTDSRGDSKAQLTKPVPAREFAHTWHEPRMTAAISPPTGTEAYTFLQWFSDYFTPNSNSIQHGDVVVVHHPYRKGGTVCKRIIALPGDQVIIPTGYPAAMAARDDGGMSSMSNHPALVHQTHSSRRSMNRHATLCTIPDGYIWLEGDNALNSSDSRHYGPVPASLVVGRVVARIWPLRGNALMRRGERPLMTVTSGQSDSAVAPAAESSRKRKASPKKEIEQQIIDEFEELWGLTRSSSVALQNRNHAMIRAASMSTSVVLPAGYEGQQILPSRTLDSSEEKRSHAE
jgi:signal peptidase I